MFSSDISNIKLQLTQLDLNNIQDLLKIGEVINAKIIQSDNNEATLDIKGKLFKAFSTFNLGDAKNIKCVVARLTPYLELKIIQDPLQKQDILFIQLDNLTKAIVQNSKDMLNSDTKVIADFIKNTFETISDTLFRNNIQLNENAFIIIPFYIESRLNEIYIKARKKLLKNKKTLQSLSIFSDTPIGFIKINVIKVDLMGCNIWVYNKTGYDLLIENKEKLKKFLNMPVSIVFKKDKPKIEIIKSMKFLDISI